MIHSKRNEFLINSCLIIFFVLIFYHHRYGLGMLIPTNVGWLMHHDWAQHFLGWYFYRNEPWTFPLGDLSNYFYPVGTNVGFTDSIPLLAIILKPFSKILPENFQYLGPWLFLCHVLLGFFTLKLTSLFTSNRLSQLLIALLVTLNPMLWHRAMHPALCSHWLFVGSFWVYFQSTKNTPVNRILMYQFIFLILSGLINPYICAMIAGFTIVLPARLCFYEKIISIKTYFSYVFGSFFLLLLCWWIVGFFSFNNTGDLGVSGAYGLYSMNLNSLYNASGFSAILPNFGMVSWHQYESFLYLGFGAIILAIAASAIFISKIRSVSGIKTEYANINIIPLVLLAFLLSIFAITNVITLNESVLFRFSIPSVVEKMGEIFRASARFFWIPYYLILLGVSVYLVKKIPLVWSSVLLIFALIVQIYDYKHLIQDQNLTYSPYQTPLSEKYWNALISKCEEIVFYPPLGSSYQSDQDYRYFCFLAAKHRKPINIGYVARQDNQAINKYTEKLNSDIDNERVGYKSLYITNATTYNRFKVLYLIDSVECTNLDGYLAFYPKRMASKEIVQLLDQNHSDIPSGLNQRISFDALHKKTVSSDNLLFGIDGMRGTEKYISLSGWAFINGKEEKSYDSISIILKNKDNLYYAKTDRAIRPDVSGHFNNSNLDSVGFSITAFTDSLPKGKYELGIMIHRNTDKQDYIKFVKTVNIGLPSIFSFSKLDKQYELLDFNSGVDRFDDQPDYLSIAGWAAKKEKDFDENAEIYVLIKSDSGQVYYTSTISTQRPDVTSYFGNKYKLDNCGYDVIVSKKNLAKGRYNVGLLIHEGNSYSAYFTDRYINY